MTEQEFYDRFGCFNELNGHSTARRMRFDWALRIMAPVPVKMTVEDFMRELGDRICSYFYGQSDPVLEAHLRAEYGEEAVNMIKERRR